MLIGIYSLIKGIRQQQSVWFYLITNSCLLITNIQSHCPGMDLAGTRDISFHSGTVPGNPGHLVTLVSHLNLEIVHSKKDSDARQANILYARHDRSDGSGTELSLSNSVLKLRAAVHCFIRSLHDYYLFS